MSQKKKKDITVSLKFGGVDRRELGSAHNTASTVKNFRILNDGSLEKRCGYRPVTDLGIPIRTVYGCHIHGEYRLFILAENKVFLLDDKENIEQIGQIDTTEGNACFFFYRQSLYLMDGVSVYQYTGSSFKTVSGYVPLVAKDWESGIIGEIYEPRNILNNHARATFIATSDASAFMRIDGYIESVEAVYLNEGRLNEDEYSVSNLFNTVTIPSIKKGDRVEIHFTYRDGYASLLDELCRSTSTALFGGIGSNRIFICGGNGTGTVFSSKNVSASSLYESRKHYPESNELYFPVGYEFEAGDGIAEIKAISRLYDRIIIFTENDVWMITPDEEGREYATTTGVNGIIGCPALQGATVAENEPVSIGYRSVFKWSSGGGNKCDALNISGAIDKELSEDTLRSYGIFYDNSKNEIWIYDKGSDVIWIYNTHIKVWYKFSGISMQNVFDYCGRVGFTSNSAIYVFDERYDCDITAHGIQKDIIAEYTTNLSSFGLSDKKRFYSITLCADLDGRDIRVRIDLDRDRSDSFSLSPRENESISSLKRRYTSESFGYASVSLISDTQAKQRIYGLTLNIG